MPEQKTESPTAAHTAQNNRALNELFRIAAQPYPLEKLLGESLDVLLSLSWLSVLPKGGIFLAEKDQSGDNLLRLVAEKNLGEPISTLCEKVRFGHCLCGRAAQTKQPLHASCVDNRHETSFDGMNPHGHYNIPIMSAEHVLGVIVLYLPDGRKRDNEEVAFICRAASVISLAIELRRKEIKLQKTNRELGCQKLGLDEHAIVSIANIKGDITYANNKFCEISGYTRKEVIGQNHRILKSNEHSANFYADLWRTIASGNVWHGEIKNISKDGGYYWVNATIVPFLDEDGQPYQYVAIRTDITEQKNIENALKQAQSVGKIGSWSLDLKTDKLIWSDQIYNIFGMDSAQFGASFSAFLDTIHPDDLDYVMQQYQGSVDENLPYDIEHRIIRKDTGEVRWVHERCIHQRNVKGEVIRSDGTVQDITERIQTQEEIHHLAMTDQLTGLANRNQFHRRFDESLKLASREKKKLVLMLLDLDEFKPVNDTFGHQVGDALLQTAASIFTKRCRETDVIARLGGDEFAILLVHPDARSGAGICAQRIIDEINKPMIIAGHEIHIGISIGISVFPEESDDQDSLIHKADMALYGAKRSGRNTFRFYTPEFNEIAT